MNLNLKNDSSNNFYGNINGDGTKINIDQRKKIVIGSIAVVIVWFVLVFGIYKAFGGGGSSLDRQIVGTWEGNDAYTMGRYHYAGEITFNSNHTYVCKDHDEITGEGTWKINSSKNLIFNDFLTLVWNENQDFSLDGQSWYISGDVMYIDGVRFDRK